MAEEGIKLFGEDGLIFDHTNPLDYLSFVPGLGVLGLGAKVLSKLGKVDKFKKFPRTQYHGGHSSVEKGEAARRGIYTTPDASYASMYMNWSSSAGNRGKEAIEKFGPTGLYKLDLSTVKNIEMLDKPSKKLKEAIKKQLGMPKIPIGSPGYEVQRRLHDNLSYLFSNRGIRGGVEGGKPVIAGRDALDWLRKQGVDALTGSRTLGMGKKAKGTEAEYFLLKDFPKKKLSDIEIEKVVKASRGYNEGGEVSNNLQNFLSVATEAIALEQAEAPTEMPKNYRDGGRVRLI